MSDLECYVIDKVVNGHCDCMFPVNTYQWELTTILALFAPKPLLFANSDMDPIFPMSGNRRIAERMRKCYDLLGAKEKFDDYVSKGGHDYRPDLRLAIFNFFQKHLLGSDAAIKDADFPKIEGKDLRVFPEDKDLPKDSIDDKADESFVPMSRGKLPVEPKGFAAWKFDLVKQLREHSFRALPEKVPKAEVFERGQNTLPGLRTEPGIEVNYVEAVVMPARARDGLPRCAIIVRNPEETFTKPNPAVPWEARSLVVLLTTRGGSGSKWTTKNPPNTIERSLALIGQTVDSGRVRDVAAYLAMFDKDGTTRLTGSGQAGIIAAYAALFVPGKVDEVVIVDPPLSHRDGPHFLNILRVCDIPEALGLLAPDVKLTLVGTNAKDKAFDRTEALYKAAGTADKFKRE